MNCQAPAIRDAKKLRAAENFFTFNIVFWFVIITLIRLTGGFDFELLFLHVSAHNVHNPLAFLLASIIGSVSLRNFRLRNDDFFTVSLVFVVSKVIILLASFLFLKLVADIDYSAILWRRWDGGWYMRLITQGYLSGRGELNFAFYPLYPLVSRSLMFLTGCNELSAALFVNHTTHFLGIFYLYKLVKKHFSQLVAERAILYISVFPTAFFFSAAYTEGLFLFVSVAAFYYAEEEDWLKSALFAGLASGTRLVGVFVGISILVLFVMKKKKQGLRHLPALGVLSFSGFLLFALYQYLQTGDILHFLNLYRTEAAIKEWGRVTHFPTYYMAIWLKIGLSRIILFVNGLIAICFLLISVPISLNRKYWLFGLYSLALVLVPFSSNLESLWRYCLVVFPVLVFVAYYSTKVRYLHEGYLALSVSLLGILSGAFVAGYHIT